LKSVSEGICTVSGIKEEMGNSQVKEETAVKIRDLRGGKRANHNAAGDWGKGEEIRGRGCSRARKD